MDGVGRHRDRRSFPTRGNFLHDLLVQTTPPFIDQEALTDLDSISYLNSNSISN
jgi:hypothetical protein